MTGMASGRFKDHHDGMITVTLLDHEVAVLRGLIAELLALLDEGDVAPPGPAEAHDPLAAFLRMGPSEPPDDAVLARLFPDAYPDDAEAAADFRRFTEPDLRDGKRAHAKAVLSSLEAGKLTLDPRQAVAWMYVLNDLRLALGTRLEVTEEYEQVLDEMAEDDPRIPVFAVYEWLAMMQDTLVHALGHGGR